MCLVIKIRKKKLPLLIQIVLLMQAKEVLHKYWSYKEFRPLQEDIINSILKKKDTLALMPTGGGKSLCYQVPALCQEGLCIVISPLIALISEQVESLRNRGIQAEALVSGMNKRLVDIALDNCIYGKAKFLYISPERLQSDLVKTRIAKMKISFIAIDEAHCISEWGYDFRPAYLKIAEVKQLLPVICPVLALTASATKRVQSDISKKLELKNPEIYRKSFNRENITYIVRKVEDKRLKLLEVISRTNGTGIIYVRTRKQAEELAEFLIIKGLQVNFYHAGLDIQERLKRQKKWMQDSSQIIVATSAFGMGIDKSDVRYVVHMNMPDSLESYYQESGRVGRDQQKAYAVLLWNETDIDKLNTFHKNRFPSIKKIRDIYQDVANYLQLAVNSGEGQFYEFDIDKFILDKKLDYSLVKSVMKYLELFGYLQFNQGILLRSKLQILLNNQALKNFLINHPKYQSLFDMVLRSYSGLFDSFISINESKLAAQLSIKEGQLTTMLSSLNNLSIVSYINNKSKNSTLVFTKPRVKASSLNFPKDLYDKRRDQVRNQIDSVLRYSSSYELCRKKILLNYFDEFEIDYCGSCDFCRERLSKKDRSFESIKRQILEILTEDNIDLKTLLQKLNTNNETVIDVLRWMQDNSILLIEDQLIVLKR